MVELGRFVVFKGRDPFTPPHTKVDWVKTSLPGVKTPVIRYQFMNSEIDLIIHGPDGADVKLAFADCVKQAALSSLIAGLAAGYVSGGTAAISGAVATFTTQLDACMEGKVKKELNVTASVENHSHWDSGYH